MYNILLAECYPQLAESFRSALADRSRYNLVVVDSGYTALEAVDLKRFDLIIIENDLPYLSGLKTARNLRKKLTFDISPFVIVVPSLEREAVEDYFGCGVADFLTIPLRALKIQSVVERILTTWKSDKDNLRNYDHMLKNNK